MSSLPGQTLGVVVATLTLAAAKAAAGRPTLEPADFQIAFIVISVIGLLRVLRCVALARDSGEDVSGQVRRDSGGALK